MTETLTSKRIIEEEQFRLVKEYPAMIKVYENIAGDCISDVIEPTTGSRLLGDPHDIIQHLPKNRNAVPKSIAYLDVLEGCSQPVAVLQSYRKNRKYSMYRRRLVRK